MKITQNYIAGAWATPSRADSAQVHDANTGRVLGSAPLSTAQDVASAVDAAAAAQPAWWAMGPAQRARFLRAIAEGLRASKSELGDSIAREVGAVQSMAAGPQTDVPIASFEHTAQVLDEYVWDETLGTNLITREPFGVVGVITAWNFPLHLVTVKVASAIAAGNTVVIKPSEVAPLTAGIFATIVNEAGVPPGVINIVFGDGPTAGEALVEHPGVSMISFTGSTRAGRRISELGSKRILKCALELGGKSPLLITEDAPLEEAVRFGVADLLLNNGQRCDGLTRMIVPHGKLAEAEQIAAEALRAAIPGDSRDAHTVLGPLASQAQLDRVRGYIRSGIEEGARLVTGGIEPPQETAQYREGYFVRPTLFSDTTPNMRIVREEIFGPVLTMQAAGGLEDAIRLANDTDYGLHAAVFAAETDHALEIGRQLHAGMVTVNGGAMDLRAPFGGYKQSGIGREFGVFGFEEFLETKALRRPDKARR